MVLSSVLRHYNNIEHQYLHRTASEVTPVRPACHCHTAAQLELNKKREQELSKLRKDLEEANIQHDATVTGLKKKQVDAVCEMNEQIDQLSKMKAK